MEGRGWGARAMMSCRHGVHIELVWLLWSSAGVAVLREHCRALGLQSRGVRLPGLVHNWSTCREMTVHVLIIIRSRLMVSINIENFTR